MKLSIYTKKKIRNLVILVLFFSLTGGIYSLFVSDVVVRGFIMGMLMAFLMSFLIIYLEFFVFNRIRKTTIYLNIFTKTVIYTLIFIFSWSVSDIAVFGLEALINDLTIYFFKYYIHIAFLLSMAVFFLLAIFLNINRLLGQKALFRLFVGKYHSPVEENRAFMFLDLASSTSIAEDIGNTRFHSFLNDFFFDITEPVLACAGEIYKYVGDEVIITWTDQTGFKNANCLQCYFRIRTNVEEKKDFYLAKYGYVPEFRAGLHAGTVVVGEMGDYKREVAYLGDVVNTASRIQAECGILNKSFLASRECIQMIGPDDISGFSLERLGEINLKGKKEKTELISISLKD